MMDKYYLLKNEVVEIVSKWTGKGPRNVLIKLPSGKLIVRPFRGLRKIKTDKTTERR